MVGGMVKGATTVGTHSVWSPLQRERIQKTFAAFGVGIAATAASSVLLYRVVRVVSAGRRPREGRQDETAGAFLCRLFPPCPPTPDPPPVTFSSFTPTHQGAAHAIANTGLLGTLGMMAVVVGSSVVVHMVPPEQTVAKYGALMLFNTAIGLTLSPLCVLGGPLLARAAAMTAGVVGSLSFVAANSPSDQYLWMAGPLAMGLGAVFVASFGALLPGGAIASVMHKVWMYGGLALFSGMCLYDTARIVETARVAPTFDPVGMSLSIYMDAVNIFVRIAMLLSGGGNRKK